jgi:hypothetical protein
MENIIERQRATVTEHIRAENAKEWSAVYDTFIQSENSYFDVVPLSTRFKGISGIKDFYQRSMLPCPTRLSNQDNEPV